MCCDYNKHLTPGWEIVAKAVFMFTANQFDITVILESEDELRNGDAHRSFTIYHADQRIGNVTCYADGYIGYGIDQHFWGNKIMPTVVKWIMRTWKRTYRLQIYGDNPASISVAHECGFEPEDNSVSWNGRSEIVRFACAPLPA